MKVVELRQKNKLELKELLKEKLAKMAELRFVLQNDKSKNLKEIRQIKLDIARIKTIQKESAKN